MTDSFARDGFTVLPQVLSRQALATARALAERTAPDGQPSCERPNNTLTALRWDDPLVLLALTDSGVLPAVAKATGARDLRWTSGYLSSKAPASGPLWWHQDWWCWEHPVSLQARPVQVAVSIYLTDTDPGRGAMRVLPGSHRTATPLHAALPEAHATHADDLAPGHPAMADHPDQVTPAIAGGDAVLLDYRLLHGTHPNTAASRRDALILNFTPDWSHLPAEIRAHLVQGPGLPTLDEVPDPRLLDVLPAFDGERRDLPLSRTAPAAFTAARP